MHAQFWKTVTEYPVKSKHKPSFSNFTVSLCDGCLFFSWGLLIVSFAAVFRDVTQRFPERLLSGEHCVISRRTAAKETRVYANVFLFWGVDEGALYDRSCLYFSLMVSYFLVMVSYFSWWWWWKLTRVVREHFVTLIQGGMRLKNLHFWTEGKNCYLIHTLHPSTASIRV